MSLAKHYVAIDNAEDARAALGSVFLANGDAIFTADKRIAECFFTRGRGRSLNMELYSYTSTSDESEEDLHVEVKYLEEANKILNDYLESKIEMAEEEFSNIGRVTKNIMDIMYSLKVAYSLAISKSDIDLLSNVSLPDIKKPLWSDIWSVSHLAIESLVHFSDEVIKPSEKPESELATLIRHKVRRDRYLILDELITYFESIDRGDIVEAIKVSEFQFINETSSSISDKYKVELEGYRVINEARIQYLSKVKVDLQYSQELIGIPASTYKKRIGAIKIELTDLGEELKQGNSNSMQDYILN